MLSPLNVINISIKESNSYLQKHKSSIAYFNFYNLRE